MRHPQRFRLWWCRLPAAGRAAPQPALWSRLRLLLLPWPHRCRSSSSPAPPAPVAAPAPAAAAPIVPAPAAAPGKSASDVVLEIVSEKTGYPADMLGLEMEMEAELSIDSIKQVEIPVRLTGQYPGAPETGFGAGVDADPAGRRECHVVVPSPAAPAPAAALVPRRPLLRGQVGQRCGAGDRVGEDRLSRGHAGSGDGDGGRARYRLHQAGRDPLGASGAVPRCPEIPGSELASMHPAGRGELGVLVRHGRTLAPAAAPGSGSGRRARQIGQ